MNHRAYDGEFLHDRPGKHFHRGIFPGANPGKIQKNIDSPANPAFFHVIAGAEKVKILEDLHFGISAQNLRHVSQPSL